MSGLLLGADAIEDLIAGDPLIVDWLTSRENQPTSASFSTIAFLLAQAHETEDVAQRELWLEEVRRFPHGPNIQMYGFDLEAAEKWAVNWANLSADKTINAKADVDFGELQLIAICLAQSLDYVAPRRPWHAKVAHLKQHDPWQGQSYGALEPAKSRYALSISGGGFAGLFAAEFLRRLEEDLGRPLGEVFDLYAGTSVGGLLALGLAHGKRASELSQMLGKIGPKLFGKPGLAIFKAKHDPAPLAAEARALFADKTLSQLTPRIVVPAVDMTAGRTRVFLNDSLNAKGASPWLFDVAMATSAAPTFLPPHRVDEQLFTDGGLVANSPEALAAMEMIHRLRWPAARTHLLVVGSTSVPARVPGYLAAQGWGKKDWLDDQTLLDLAMAGQMTLARQTAEAILGPGRVIVADVELSGRETEFVALDKADAKAAATLRGLAASAYATFSAQQAGFINRLRT